MAEDSQAPAPKLNPPAKTIIQGRTSLTVLGWTAWTFALVLTVLLTLVDGSTFWVAAASLALFTTATLALFRRKARRAQWIVLLDDARLSIQRLPPGNFVAVQSLNVVDGVQIDVAADKSALRLDSAIAIRTGTDSTLWCPGIRPAQAIARLAAFLRENGVSVMLASDVPIGWTPPDYPNIPH
jgi:hypothetical protein